MKRMAAFAAGAAMLFATGCAENEMLFGRLTADKPPPNAVKMPEAKNVPQASLAVAERVEMIGRKIIVQNTFTGLDPVFMCIGDKATAAVFHIGTGQLVITEGMVEKCGSDAELAAVLCSEMGQMVAEKRAAKALGRDIDPARDANFGAGASPFPGGTAFDAGRSAELAYHEQKHPRTGGAPSATDATQAARDLLKGAGYSPAELDRVEPLLKSSEKAEALKKSFLARPASAEPKWQK
jgi:hypothetical protein